MKTNKIKMLLSIAFFGFVFFSLLSCDEISGNPSNSGDIFIPSESVSDSEDITSSNSISEEMPHFHEWNDGEITKEATCTENGEITYTCTSCDEIKVEEVAALGHTTTTGICERCEERQGWTQKEVQSLIKVYDVFVSDIDSADGVDMTIAWENTSSKTIKYIYFSVEAYNAVDDKVACEIRGSYEFTGELTGPFKAGYTNLIYDSDDDKYYANTVFENCYYNANIRYFKLTNIRVLYMDDTEFELEEDYVEYPFSYVPQGLIYTWNDEYNGYEVNYRLKDTCTDTHISIPSKHNGHNVVSIANKGFRDISSLKSVTIPDTIRYIGDSAFASCSSLTTIELPDSVTDIGESAFFGCDNLRSITIPYRVSDIKDWTFFNCESLSNINMSDGLESIGQYSLSNCSSLTTIIIPDSVIDIGYNAFLDTPIKIATIPTSAIPDIINDNLKKVIITSGDTIGQFAFMNCVSLTSVIIPNSVTKIDSHAFEGCVSLESITIPDTVTSIGYDTFKNCDSLTTIDIPDSVTSICSGAFEGCDSLIIARISGDFSSIGSFAFRKCPLLTSVSIFNGVESIDGFAFADCPSLKTVYIPESVQYVSGYAFWQSTEVTIYCETSSESDGWDPDWNYIYYDSRNEYAPVVWDYEQEIDSLKFSLSDDETYYIVAGIGSYVDSNLAIPEKYKGKPVKEIADCAFEYNTSITSVSIPEGITRIGYSAFYSCSNITNIVLPNSVTYIDDWAFKDCTSLTSIFITESVNNIGSSVFSGCTSLSNINVDENNDTYKSIFGDLYSKDGTILIQYSIGKSNTSYTIPDGVTRIGDYAFLMSINLTSVIIPNSVTSIGWDAFNICDNLTIYCFVNDKPAGWDSDWNYSYEHSNGTDYCTVVWGYTT